MWRVPGGPRARRQTPLPDGRARDRGADEGAQGDPAGERGGALVGLDRGTGDRAHERLDRRREVAAVAHEPAFGRRVGPRIATTATNPSPTHETADGASSRKSPIRNRSMPSRAPSASPAHAPRNAASTRSRSWPPADPRMSTYKPVWKI